MTRFRDRLMAVASLQGLLDLAVDLHGAEGDADHPALAAIVAGWSCSSEVGPRILEILRPWDELVADALRRSLASTPFGRLIPTEDLAHGISALFLGIELLSRLDRDDKRTESLFMSLSGAASLAGPVLETLAAGSASE
jgi:hypothetical protein